MDSWNHNQIIADLTASKAKPTATKEKAFKTITENRTVIDYAPPDFKWQTLDESESKHDIVVTWFINPNKLYCQLLSKETEFKAMMSEIQKTYADRKPVTHKLEVMTVLMFILFHLLFLF